MHAPILQAVPRFGPPHARRYAIVDRSTNEVWSGEEFTADWTKARLYAMPSSVSSDMQQILRTFYAGLPHLQKSRCMKHHAALRKLAGKWIRILFRVWHTRTPYDPDRYLKSLQKKHTPIIPFLEIGPDTP